VSELEIARAPAQQRSTLYGSTEIWPDRGHVDTFPVMTDANFVPCPACRELA